MDQRRRSEIMGGFEREVARARILLVDRERRRSSERLSRKDKSVLSMILQREEESVMRVIREKIGSAGWHIGTLIHDAVVITRDGRDDERGELERNATAAVREACSQGGWDPDLLRFSMTKL